MIDRTKIEEEFKKIQDEICTGLEDLDGIARFEEDAWQRDGGGGGRTRIIRNGELLEKGGVNFSAVHGELPDVLKKELNSPSGDFFATGVSIVLHPNNPHVPIIHMNIRYFETDQGNYWFGGGIDLTPHYITPHLAEDFHERLKSVCDNAHPAFYPKFKAWADDYFFIPHREETRGIGGIFFDKLNSELSKEELFDFVCAVGRSFLPTYTFQVLAQRDKPHTETEKQWQLIRRGRYVEFNLVYDRGTKFGLQTGGRIESILMSLPEQANWYYNFQVEPNSGEANTLQLLKKGVDWVDSEEED